MAPHVGVLALQGGFREHEQALAEAGADVRHVREVDDLPGLDGLVVPGGESTTISLLAQRSGLLGAVRDEIDNGMAVFGTCAGMIMLADRVLDGRDDRPSFGGLAITVRRNAFGRQVDSFETSLDIPVLGEPVYPAVFIRAPWVEQVSPEVEIIAQLCEDDQPATIVAVRQGRLLAASFHPELTDDRRLHQYFINIVKGEA